MRPNEGSALAYAEPLTCRFLLRSLTLRTASTIRAGARSLRPVGRRRRHEPDTRVIFGTGRRRRDFVDSVERAIICPEHAQTLDASGAATPYTGRCELAPTTTVAPHAQVNYSKRFRVAYGRHRSRAVAPRRPPTTTSSPSRTDLHGGRGHLLSVTTGADTRIRGTVGSDTHAKMCPAVIQR